jgi:glyoxylase-like metal-dependent hydrolase (beta-lactamase superfamily II)
MSPARTSLRNSRLNSTRRKLAGDLPETPHQSAAPYLPRNIARVPRASNSAFSLSQRKRASYPRRAISGRRDPGPVPPLRCIARVRRLGVLVIIAAVLSIVGTAPAAAAGRGQRPLKYGDVVQVAPRTLMIVGRELAPAKGEGDIADAIIYRSGDTLYVIDTGATPSFRPFLGSAIRRLRPFREVVLINTHGHPDHFGNNSLITKMHAVSVRHYMSRRDFGLADRYLAALTGAFQRVSGYVPGFSDPAAQARALFDLFKPLNQSRRTRRAIESLPLRSIHIGQLRMQGWTLGRDDVDVLRTAGHSPGELIVYFPKTHLLHMGDELVSYYPAFPEASPGRTRRTFVRALAAASGGAVRILTDGHNFSVLRGADRIRQRLRAFIHGYDAYDRAMRRLLRAAAPAGATVSELVAGIADAPELRGAPGGADDGGPFFGALQVLMKLGQVHAVSTGEPRATRRYRLPST